MPATAETSNQVMIAGSVLSLLGMFLTAWLTTRSTERRDAAVDRREADKIAREDLVACEETCARLERELSRAETYCALLKGVLIANHIPIPTDR